jgi:hypothetical protein
MDAVGATRAAHPSRRLIPCDRGPRLRVRTELAELSASGRGHPIEQLADLWRDRPLYGAKAREIHVLEQGG